LADGAGPHDVRQPQGGRASLEGVLVVDKPRGLTSHDVVARVRRALRERRVGHAGTLDPMATGVLVVLVGEGTKLAPYLTAADKRYVARVAFGTGTATLDADGEVIARAEVPAALLAELEAIERDPGAAPAIEGGLLAGALRAEAERASQVPPAFSAIHVEGARSHELAREGKAVPLEPRAVAVRALRVISARASGDDAPSVDLDVLVSKGYYVRSLARDLGERLGVPAHLSALRRTESGAFTLDHAAPLDAGEKGLRDALAPMADAALRALPAARLTEPGARRARQGKRLEAGDFAEGAAPPVAGVAAWLDLSGRIVAIGEADEASGFTVLRGFVEA
jgi:tRNA pseudouridine55 synthase